MAKNEVTEATRPKSNYERLQDNKEQVLKFANDIPYVKDQIIADPEIKRGEVKKLVEKADPANAKEAIESLTAAIERLNEIKDNKIGIVWHKEEDLGNGTGVRVRDARNVILDPEELKKDAGEKYAMQILNQTRGGLDLLEKSDLPPELKKLASEQLMFIANEAVSNIDQLNNKTIKSFNTMMLYALEKAGMEDAERKLNFAKEIANFKDEHRHIVTLTPVLDDKDKQHTLVEASIMLNGLTEKQQGQYKIIADSTKGEKTEVKWFDIMPPWKQDLVRDVAGDIASGNKIIPTQLLGDVVGLRNGYQKVTAIKGPDEVLNIRAEDLQCGAPATKIKGLSEEDQLDIVVENIKQTKSFSPPGEQTNLNTLNSKTPGNVRGEDFIFKQSEEASKEVEGVKTSASPINRWRILGGGRDTRQFKKNLELVGQGLVEAGWGDLKNVSKHLKKGGSVFGNMLEAVTFGAYKTTETKANNELKVLKEKAEAYEVIAAHLETSKEKAEESKTKAKGLSDLAKDLEVAMEARNLADSSVLFAKSENVNSDLTETMTAVKNSVKREGRALNAVLSLETKSKYPNDVVFCKSGKDRTGYVTAKSTFRAVLTYFGLKSKSKNGEKNLLSQIAGGHTQEIAGTQGGTIGCHSIKTNPEFALNKEDKAIDGIINQESSRFNSSIKTVEVKTVFGVKGKKEKRQIIQKFEEKFKTAQEAARATGVNEPSITSPSQPTIVISSEVQHPQPATVKATIPTPPTPHPTIVMGSVEQQQQPMAAKASIPTPPTPQPNGQTWTVGKIPQWPRSIPPHLIEPAVTIGNKARDAMSSHQPTAAQKAQISPAKTAANSGVVRS